MLKLGRYSFGIGDRFSHQGAFGLEALINAKKSLSVDFTPVWNKSNREHQIVGSTPQDTKAEADNAVKYLGFKDAYFVDADHINMNNVDKFLEASNFFTIDVADYIGKKAEQADIDRFIEGNKKYIGELSVPKIDKAFQTGIEVITEIADKYLYAIQEAGRIYRYIVQKKGVGNFITEVSMDEVDYPQTPVEIFFILSALAMEGVPAQTIAPKFSGRFNKGVDYVGDVKQFEIEFEQDLLVMDYAVKEFGLPSELKLSIHSGSDKFSIYPIMGKLIQKHDKGIHIKTAGTTWLEEMIGLSLADKDALKLAKKIAIESLGRLDELCAPYATVIDINRSNLPTAETIENWTGEQFARALRHEQSDPKFNPDFRQAIHVSYKIAAEYGEEFYAALERNREIVGAQVCNNIYSRHIVRLLED